MVKRTDLSPLGFSTANSAVTTLGVSRRRFLAGASTLALGCALSGVAPWGALAQATPKRGGSLKVAVPAATSIDPVKLNSSGGIAIVQQTAEYLVYAEPDLSLRPVLATSWEPSEGGKVWTFKLRQGVKFHDGRPMGADDVVASFQRLVDPANASPAAGAMPFLKKEGIAKVDDHTVRFTLDRPIGTFPYFTHTYNCVILPADYAGNFAEKPIGTGPFKLVSYRPQEGAKFERNTDYWDQTKPYLDRLEIQTFESPQPMVLALQSGDIQVVQQLSYIDAQAIRNDSKIALIQADAADHRQLCMRTDMKPFDDKRVRQAVALCFDRPAMVRGLLGGLADVGNDHPIAPIYPEKIKGAQRQANIAQAKKLLADAGYPQGFPIDLYTHQYLELPQYAALTQQMLAPAGIKVNLKVEPTNLYYNHWTEVSFGLTDWTSRPVAAQILAQSFRSTAEWNAAHWKSEPFDALLAKFEAEPDVAQRGKLGTEMAAILTDEVPAVIAYFNKNLRAARTGVQGLTGSMSNYLDMAQVWVES
ncbi:peptide ABC transporter substrate-binding protein [Skermanella stibiiresistens SB22]|uniref:Peptide ABC transporter substrate-binding protein n=1 Tax=Skermanella stibiiresistens SB22 TaxID=1385369 RepID=W9HCZ5_9PROT|nr:ABC transporter substrate-binding protein [Skermanella stibiiresistens]EWY41758.1 peptide ABC transporter substrate-binding protein [Skermanella stibiiresistens SB22]